MKKESNSSKSLKTMTDEQLDQWAGEIIDMLITDHNKKEKT